jgi:hypothetical protein
MLTKSIRLLVKNRICVAGALVGVAMLVENESRRPMEGEFDRLVATSFAAGLIENHNTTASMPVQDLSELSRAQLGAAHLRFAGRLREAMETFIEWRCAASAWRCAAWGYYGWLRLGRGALLARSQPELKRQPDLVANHRPRAHYVRQASCN